MHDVCSKSSNFFNIFPSLNFIGFGSTITKTCRHLVSCECNSYISDNRGWGGLHEQKAQGELHVIGLHALPIMRRPFTFSLNNISA